MPREYHDVFTEEEWKEIQNIINNKYLEKKNQGYTYEEIFTAFHKVLMMGMYLGEMDEVLEECEKRRFQQNTE